MTAYQRLWVVERWPPAIDPAIIPGWAFGLVVVVALAALLVAYASVL